MGVKHFKVPHLLYKEINKLTLNMKLKLMISCRPIKGMIIEAGRFLQIIWTIFALSEFSSTSSDIDNIDKYDA